MNNDDYTKVDGLVKVFTQFDLQQGSGLDVIALFVACIVSIYVSRNQRREVIQLVCRRIQGAFDELDEKLGIGSELH